MIIREAIPQDFDQIAAITNHYIHHTHIHFSYQPVTAEELRTSWEKSRTRHPFLVLVNNPPPAPRPTPPPDLSPSAPPLPPPLLGYAKSARWRDRTAYDRTAEVGIYLHHQHLAQGHGRRLYAALIDACRAKNFHSLLGGIALPNDASVRLHESLGFVHTGTVREAGWKFDMWHDVGFWQLMLDER